MVVLVAGLVVYFAKSGAPNPKIAAAIVAVFVVLVILLVVLFALRARKSGGSSGDAPGTAQALATELGYDYVRKPPKSFRVRFAHIPEIKNKGENKHVISGDLDGRQITFFNNTYIIPAGQVVIPVMHCVFACAGPDWPTLSVTPRGTLGRLFARMSSNKGITLENHAFNRAFKVSCADGDFAITLLSRELQEFMLEKTSGMKWRIGSGMVCMVYSGTLKLHRVPASLDRMRRFWSLIPSELESW